MTPKEKAKELVKKFDELLPSEGTTTGQTPIDCAMILVDEIISQFINKCCEHQNRTYWEKVKQELEKL